MKDLKSFVKEDLLDFIVIGASAVAGVGCMFVAVVPHAIGSAALTVTEIFLNKRNGTKGEDVMTTCFIENTPLEIIMSAVDVVRTSSRARDSEVSQGYTGRGDLEGEMCGVSEEPLIAEDEGDVKWSEPVNEKVFPSREVEDEESLDTAPDLLQVK